MTIFRAGTTRHAYHTFTRIDANDNTTRCLTNNILYLQRDLTASTTKVQNLVTQTDGEAWATAFAEVSLFVSYKPLPGRTDMVKESRSAEKHPKMGY